MTAIIQHVPDRMPHELPYPAPNLDRLVRYCQRLLSHPEAAEEVAHEAVIAAWQQRHQLRDWAAYERWLFGIARNMCRRWRRNQKHESKWLMDDDPVHATDQTTFIENCPDPIDLEVELERHELADLLDRALALLPPTTRTMLIQRYIEDEPQSEIARRLKTSEGAIEARIHRGKLALRHILTTQLQSEAIAYGLCSMQQDRLEETRIWCPNCGQRHLQGHFKTDDLSRTLELHCPHCTAHTSMGDVPGLFDGIHGFRAALSRLAHWHHGFFKHALAGREVKCQRCGHPTPVVVTAEHGIDPTVSCSARCPSCGQWAIQTDTTAIALNLPQAQAFWREHQRIATQPTQFIQVSGESRLLITLQSVRSLATLDLVLAGESLTPLSL